MSYRIFKQITLGVLHGRRLHGAVVVDLGLVVLELVVLAALVPAGPGNGLAPGAGGLGPQLQEPDHPHFASL